MISEKNNPVPGFKVRPDQPPTEFAGHERRYAPPPVRKGRFVTVGIVACLLGGVAWFALRPAHTKVVNTTVSATGITTDSATIVWDTGSPLSSQVEYGTGTARGLLSEFKPSPVTSHSVTLKGLKAGTTYSYVALSTDPNGKVSKSADSTFRTAGASGAPVATGALAENITSTSATITWTTDQPLTSQVEFGLTKSYGSLSAFGSAPVTSHSVTLTGLKAGITYNYAALSTNSSGQTTTSPNGTFTTSRVAGTPVISSADVAAITTTSAKIIWTTDQPCGSQVEFGPTAALGLLSAFVPALTTSHSLLLTGLKPGTSYSYIALSTSSSGQVGKSAGATFTTASASTGPAISAITTSGGKTGSATINWTTDQPSSSQIEYGTTTAHGLLSAFNPSRVTSHSVTLNGLIPGETYNFTALSTGELGTVGRSVNSTFIAGAGPPVISQIGASNITGTSATIAWTTDQPTTSQVDFGPTSLIWSLTHRHRRPYSEKSRLDTRLSRSHSVTITGLTPGTTYDYAVTSANSGGLQNLSSNQKLATSRH